MLPRPQKQVEPTGAIMQHDKSSGSVDHRLKPVVDGSLNLVVSPQTVVVPTTDSVERGIGGGGGGGAGGGPFNKDETSQRLGGVILPPSSSTFRRLKEHRDQQEEFVIRERYLSRPALLSLGGEDEGGQQPGIKYQAWSAHPDHAPHIGPRQSSTMRTPETPEEFRLRVLRTTESMKGGPATASAGRGMSSPVNDHPAILYPSPSSFYTKQARMGDSTTSPRPSTHTSAVATPPNQELRYHPFAQDSLFRHRSPNKPFKTGPEPGTTMTTNSSGGSIESPAHLQYQLRQSPLTRPPQKQPSSSSSAEKQDLKSHSPQHQQTWHRPVRDTPPTRTSNTTPTSSLAPVKIAKDAAASVVVDFPTHFRLGTLIQLSNGDLKTVETLTTLDFVQSAETSPEVNIDHSVVTTLDLDIDKGMANITFSVGKQKVQVPLPITRKHPPNTILQYLLLFVLFSAKQTIDVMSLGVNKKLPFFPLHKEVQFQ